MTYMTFDILPTRTAKGIENKICEVAGLDSGIRGFLQIYGDDRVGRIVNEELSRVYGATRSVDLGLYRQARQKFSCPSVTTEDITDYLTIFAPHIVEQHQHLIKTQLTHLGTELYLGQEGPVANISNNDVHRKNINPYVMQQIMRDKSLQARFFKDHPHYVTSTTFDPASVIRLPSEYVVVKKPISAKGRDVYIMPRLAAASLDPVQAQHLVVQPFLDTRINNTQFASYRAIVVNGQFIDAYARVSTNPIVNLDSKAVAMALPPTVKKDIGSICEEMARTLLDLCLLAPEHIRKEQTDSRK